MERAQPDGGNVPNPGLGPMRRDRLARPMATDGDTLPKELDEALSGRSRIGFQGV